MKTSTVGRAAGLFCFAALLVLAFHNLRSTRADEKRRVVAADDGKQDMGFDDWMNGKFSYRTFYPRWVSGSEFVVLDADRSIVKREVETEEEMQLFEPEVWNARADAFAWSVSADLQFAAIFHGSTDGYAHYVRTFSVDIWNATSGEKISIPNFPSEGMQKLKWSSVGHDFAFVQGFDVYVVTDFGKEPHPVTTNGDEQLMFNGISDWLFSVEITDDDALLWWSPDGSYLAFATIDQSGVEQFEMGVYDELQYPKIVKFPFPKPGTAIPAVSVSVHDLKGANTSRLAANIDPSWDGPILNSAVWRGNVFMATWKNRVENNAVTENCPAPGFSCSHAVIGVMTSQQQQTLDTLWNIVCDVTHEGRVGITSCSAHLDPGLPVHWSAVAGLGSDDDIRMCERMTSQSTSGWLGHYKVADVVPVTDANEYLTVESVGGYPHVALHDVTGDSADVRTSGAFEVTDTSSGYAAIHYYDKTWDWIYFSSTERSDEPGQGLPRIRHLWRVKAYGEDKERTCISCQLNLEFKDRCNWVTPSFSTDGSFLVLNCGGTANGAPLSTLHKRNAVGEFEFVRVAENNTALQSTLEAYNFRHTEFGSLQLPGVEGEWFYMLLKPPNFDPAKKYPLLVQVYSGPAYQEVEDRFSVSWKDYVASSKEVVVMSFDGRGTGFRGDEIMHMVYKKLGQYEPLDQIAAAKRVGEENAFIDTSRTAIWGWSYGGYATTRTIGEDSDGVFKCGFAVAPVTKWEFYSTIYTERYMLQPQDNQEGYSKSTTMQKMENFKKHRYSLFHGTRDENVHFQNSADLSKYLIASDVDFRAFFAADDDHHMGWVPNDYRNIYKMLTRQMDICFAERLASAEPTDRKGRL